MEMNIETFATIADAVAVIGSMMVLTALLLTVCIIVKCARHGRKH